MSFQKVIKQLGRYLQATKKDDQLSPEHLDVLLQKLKKKRSKISRQLDNVSTTSKKKAFKLEIRILDKQIEKAMELKTKLND